MLAKTKGIVISYIKYSETSIICKIFTEAHGLQSFIINGIRAKSSKTKIGLFQPLTKLDLVIYYKETRSLQRISEVKCNEPLNEIATYFPKTCVAMFMVDVLQQALTHENTDQYLFHYLDQVISDLEHAKKGEIGFFPTQFIVSMSKAQGVLPQEVDELMKQVNEYHSFKLSVFEEQLIQNLLTGSPIELQPIDKKKVFDILITFYKQAIGDGRAFNSIPVLREIL
ncbi:MAG: DNA repair protein RecO [Cyclobacteriaceae bacterium]